MKKKNISEMFFTLNYSNQFKNSIKSKKYLYFGKNKKIRRNLIKIGKILLNLEKHGKILKKIKTIT